MAIAQASTRLSLKNILFTTDFSAASETAFPYARAFARWYGSRIFVTHVIPREPQLSVPLDALPKSDNPYWQSAEIDMAAFLARNSFADTPHEVVMEQGDLWHVIANEIDKIGIDFLVLGTHGRQGLKKLVLGSTAEEIFRMVSCPVLTVGPKAAKASVSFENFKHIVFATDFSPASLHALDYATSIAQENQAQLTLLHLVSLVPMQQQDLVLERAKEKLRQLLPADACDWCKPEFVANIEFASDGILRAAQERSADLIVMGVHKTTAPRTAAHLPWAIAYDVVSGAHCPVLTVRD